MRSKDFEETVFADDLNAFKVYANSYPNYQIFQDINDVQDELHAWGKPNRVEFDAGKESKHIISKLHAEGDDFRLLGVDFDCKLVISSIFLPESIVLYLSSGKSDLRYAYLVWLDS